MSDPNAEFNRYRALCSAAAQALQSGKAPEAVENFSQALQIARLYSPGSQDEAYCLQGLADSLYAAFNFAEAKATYQQLEVLANKLGEVGSDPHFNVWLRIASCHQKLHEFDQACAVYARALAIAEVKVPYGNPKMTNLLELYANVLRFARKDPQVLAEIEQKARLSRSRQNNPQLLKVITAQAAESSPGTPDRQRQTRDTNARVTNPKVEQTGYGEEESKSNPTQAFLKDHPRIFMGSILVLFIFLMQIFGLIGAIDEIQGKTPPPEGSAAALGRIYTSADGKETVQFKEHGKADITTAAGTTNVRFYSLSPGWSEFIATYIMQKPNQVWLVPNSQGLKDVNGNKQLYDLKVCPIIDIPERMDAIAKACLLHILQFKKYPDATTLLGTVKGAGEKMSDGLEHLPVIIQGEKIAMTKDMNQFIARRSTELIHDKLTPSKIVCMTMPDAQKMIIAATDSSGEVMKSQLGVQYVIAVNGEVQDSSALTTHIAFFDRLPNSIVVSKSAPAVIQRLYTTLLIALSAAIGLAFAGYKLKTYNSASNRSGFELTLRMKALAWLAIVIVGLFTLYQLEETCSALLFR